MATTDAPNTPKPAGPGLGTVRRAIARSPVLFTAILLVAVGAGVAVAVALPLPKLTAYVLFRIPAYSQHIITPTDREDFGLFRQNQSVLVKSRLVLNAALRNPAVVDALGPAPDKVSALENQLKVDFKNGPEFMRLYAEGDDAEKTLALVSGVAEAYLSDVVNKKKTLQRDRRGRLEAVETEYAKKVEQTSKRLNDLISAERVITSDDARVLNRDRKSQLLTERLRAESDLRQAQVELSLLGDPATAQAALLTAAAKERLSADPDYRARVDARDRAKADLEDSRGRLQPGRTTPGLEALAKQVTELDAQVTASEARAKTDVTAAVKREVEQSMAVAKARADGRVKFCQQMLAMVDTNLRELAQDGLRAKDDLYDTEGLKVRRENERAVLTRVQGELTAILLEADAPDRVVRAESDVVPGVEGNKRLKYGAMAAAGVLALGLAGLLARELRSPRVEDQRQLVAELNLPLVGTLPLLDTHGGAAAVARAASESSLELHLGAIEAVTAACTVLHHGFGGDLPARVVMVASSVSGEGKTTVALLLASNMARAGHRTLLVDGDLRRPNLHAHLGVEAGIGLCGLLTDGGPVADAVQETDVPNLSVLPAGRWSRAVSYALGSGRRWREVVDEAAAQFDYVIVDTSPLLPVADGLLLARAVDGVVLSVMRGKSELAPVREAVRQLEAIDKRVFGVVLNGIVTRSYYTYPYRPGKLAGPELVPLTATAAGAVSD